MAVALLGKPSPVCWTKNPIEFGFAYALVQTTWKLHVQIVDTNGTFVYGEVQYPFTATAGGISIPMQGLLDPLVAHVVPAAFTGQQEQTASMKPFRLRWRTITGLGTATAWTLDAQTYIAIKGGIAHLNGWEERQVNGTGNVFTPAKFFPSTAHNFLTWIPSGRLITPDEYAWLNYFSTDSANNQFVVYDVTFADGTFASSNQNLPTYGGGDFQYRYFNIPVGITQCALDPTGKGVRSVTVKICKNHAIPTILSSYTFNIDNRPYYDTMTVHYINSFSGVETLKLRGAIQGGASVEKKEYEQLPVGSNVFGKNPYYDSDMRATWKANSGFMTDEHATALLDMVNSLHMGIILNNVWQPVRIKNKEAVYRNTVDKKNNFPIELESAGTFKTFPAELMKL